MFVFFDVVFLLELRFSVKCKQKNAHFQKNTNVYSPSLKKTVLFTLMDWNIDGKISAKELKKVLPLMQQDATVKEFTDAGLIYLF